MAGKDTHEIFFTKNDLRRMILFFKQEDAWKEGMDRMQAPTLLKKCEKFVINDDFVFYLKLKREEKQRPTMTQKCYKRFCKMNMSLIILQ